MSALRQLAVPVLQLDLDLIERFVVSVLFAFFAGRMLTAVLADATYMNFLILISESVVVVFVVIRRRATVISRRPSDWALGFAGTFAALLAVPAQGQPVIPTGYCALLMLFGFTLQLWAKLTLRRSFGVVAANRGIKIDGPYRFVRHPMYSGYILTHVAFVLAGPNLWNLVVYASAFILFVARIAAEERILEEDPDYRSLRAKVRYRLIPLVF